MPRVPRHTASRRRGLAACREGRHRFGPGNEAGGGIIRRVCRFCGALSVDLTAVTASRKGGFALDRPSINNPVR
ncbi:MAG TPA: hypothetical protein VJQ57_05845 [Acidimicrobiia bacterium]|nr:hypothetical protein [Acidimicrobiia bacterium]